MAKKQLSRIPFLVCKALFQGEKETMSFLGASADDEIPSSRFSVEHPFNHGRYTPSSAVNRNCVQNGVNDE